MGFERGAIGYRMYHLPKKLPSDVIERFAELGAPGFGTPVEGPIFGWVTGRHLLDRQIEEHTALYSGWLRMTLLEAEFKIPASLLKAEVSREELVHLAASDREYLSRKEKSEIRKSMVEVLLPNMPPHLKGTPFVCQPDGQELFGTGLSDRASDIFVLHFRQATGVSPIPMVPESAAVERLQIQTAAWSPVSFSESVEPHEVSDSIGLDFLTWLWFSAEKNDGVLRFEDLPEISIMIEGPLTFVMEGEGAHETVLRKGAPTLSPESSACLRAGKKLSKAKLNLSMNGELWSTMLDAETFVFRGTKLSEPEEPLEAVSLFEDRMNRLGQLNEMFFGLYDYYVKLRNRKDSWKSEVQTMRDWVKNRD